MTKKLIQNLSEYRQWAWNTLTELDDNKVVAKELGLLPVYECWDVNEKGEEIDEDGNVIPEDTAETVKIEDWVSELQFPVVAVYWLEKEYDRHGDVTIVAVEFVSLNEFQKPS